MNRSCRLIGGPRHSAVSSGGRRKSWTLLPAGQTNVVGGKYASGGCLHKEDIYKQCRIFCSSFSREDRTGGQVSWSVKASTDAVGREGRDGGVDPMPLEGNAGRQVTNTAGKQQAIRNAGKTVVVGMLAALSVGSMQASTSQMPFASLALAIPAVSAEALATAFRSAWAGLAAGCLHTLAGADHLAALTPLTIGQSHLRASMLGALWGFGHSTGQLLLGLAMVVRDDLSRNFGGVEVSGSGEALFSLFALLALTLPHSLL